MDSEDKIQDLYNELFTTVKKRAHLMSTYDNMCAYSYHFLYLSGIAYITDHKRAENYQKVLHRYENYIKCQ